MRSEYKIKIASAVVALLMAASLCGCKDGEQGQSGTLPTPAAPGAVTAQTEPPQEKKAAGFDADLLSQMGLGFGTMTPVDFEKLVGKASGRSDMPMDGETVVTLDYDGLDTFEFDGGSGDDSRLFYAEVFSERRGPAGICVGMIMDEVAEKFFAGSAEMLSQNTAMEMYFYGEGTDKYGLYRRMEQEFVGESGIYELEYSFSDGGKNTKLVITFDENKTATCYAIERI